MQYLHNFFYNIWVNFSPSQPQFNLNWSWVWHEYAHHPTPPPPPTHHETKVYQKERPYISEILYTNSPNKTNNNQTQFNLAMLGGGIYLPKWINCQTPTRLGTQPERTWTNLNKSGSELTLFSHVTRTRTRRTSPNFTLQEGFIGLYWKGLFTLKWTCSGIKD